MVGSFVENDIVEKNDDIYEKKLKLNGGVLKVINFLSNNVLNNRDEYFLNESNFI